MNATASAAENWATWTKWPDPIFEGQYIASDPTVLAEDDGYRMFYTCFQVPEGPFDPETVRAAICAATSDDGIEWTEVTSSDPTTPGLVLAGREGEWDENLEGSFVIVRDGRYLLYASGYSHIGDPVLGYPAALMVAESTDGINFERIQDEPILPPTEGWYDNDAVYSPAIVEYNEHLLMIYAGHCYSECDRGYGNVLLSATSDDGIAWTKGKGPVLEGNLDGSAWTKDGVAEPALFQGPDDRWYLFFTGLEGEARQIGIADRDSPVGPWEHAAGPLFTPDPDGFDAAGDLAPHVLIEGNRVRMWFLGMGSDEDIAIGYAEATWPLLGP